ncbi:MAG: SPOR domain-containing protein [Gammaproteobacteria bacterium]|nr:SPOR domain-containing protein [Gammaproteobacteria bacterium]
MLIGLKERLIGAAVLVVLAIIIIPWVLKGGSAPSTTVTRQLALPQATTAPAAESTYHMALNGPTVASTRSVAATAQPAPATATSHTAMPVVRQPVVTKSSAPAVTPAPATHAAAHGKWAVQAGSYANERNARVVERKLAKRGYHAYVSRYHKSGRTYYRVRVGPYADRAAAERVVPGVARTFGGRAEVVPNS